MSSTPFKGTFSVLLPIEADTLKRAMKTTPPIFDKSRLDEKYLMRDPLINRGQPFKEDQDITVMLGLREEHLSLVKEAVAEVTWFAARFGPFKVFENSEVFEDGVRRSYDVLYRPLIHESLTQLHDLIVKKTGVKWAYDSYQPHFTCAYLKPTYGRRYAEELQQEEKYVLSTLTIDESLGITVDYYRPRLMFTDVRFKKFQDKSYTPVDIPLSEPHYVPK